MTDDAIYIEPVVTWRSGPGIDPRPILFTCAICERDIHGGTWIRDGRSREEAPICFDCEQAYGGYNLFSHIGPKMDARIIRRGKAAVCFLECLVRRVKQERKYRGA